MPWKQINDEKLYRKLRKHGESKEMSARIANAPAAASPARLPRRAATASHTRDQDDLMKRAKKVGIKGRSSTKKPQLVSALRRH
jgi:hypothetical protein